ncbi:hypothetical protein SEA_DEMSCULPINBOYZ_75 [Mycobacterium phage Demsculpinboyz]|uniref:Uncharacterized protein n=1 Tax=Mycobacterium phage Demsculpinboyz TaxID=2041528 RepID=A0A2D1GAC0_9CAUD|nr:hypothetical protein I5I02_gp075 [Mycobacterium phage Demsculpinboyz]ATN88670.1 hypothetical protein SEA_DEMSCULPINBOYZ_75 [Mycobacterium phage Demsculpinboyz]
MSDPAVEAAQRVFADMPGLAEPMEQPVFRALLNDVATSAAREALKPICAAYENLKYECHNSTNPGIRAGLALALARLAPLIFESEED